MKLLYLLPLALLLGAAGCKKDPIKTLPKATQDGKNTMGCLVDGKAWTPVEASTLIGGSSPVYARWDRRRTGGGNLILLFNKRKEDEAYSDIYLFTRAAVQAGTFNLDQVSAPSSGSANPSYGDFIMASETPNRHFLTGPQAMGTLTLTRLDTVACIAAGTFSFTGRHAATGQTVQVTEGRFDVRFTKE